MTLSIERIDDPVEAYEVTDEGQILAMACRIRLCEGSGDDVAELADVAHVNAAQTWIDRDSPTHGSSNTWLKKKFRSVRMRRRLLTIVLQVR